MADNIFLRDGISPTKMLVEHPFIATALIFAVICVYTRIQTGIKAHSKATVDDSGTKAIPLVPYWIPWLGHTLPFAIGFQEYLKKLEKSSGGVFALKIAGGTHNIVTSPSLAREILGKAGIPIASDELTFYMMKNFFGDHGTIEEISKTPDGQAFIWGGAHKVLSNLMRDPFLSQATTAIVKTVEDSCLNLVSGNESWVDQAYWERTAEVEITSIQGNEFVAEANLHLLLRDWVGHAASTVIMGHSFMDHNPEILRDIWLLDSRFNKLLLGLPYWLIPGLAPAHRARERLIESIREHHAAMYDVMDGKDPGTLYDDLSDVPQFMWDRVDQLRKAGASPRCYSASDLAILWAMNINANQVVFWTIFYLYSNPEILATIRKEISPFVKFREPKSTGLPINEPPKLDLDTEALVYKSPYLRGAFYEAMRLEAASVSYKNVVRDFTVTESEMDAKIAGKSRPETYLLKKGQMLCIPNKVHQDSATYFSNPDQFDPTRFFVTGDDSELRVDYKTMRPWGGGSTMCKGRNFAEREVLLFVAGVIMCWDMEPANKKMVMKDGSWKHPGRIIAAGTAVPKNSFRVKMSRSKKW